MGTCSADSGDIGRTNWGGWSRTGRGDEGDGEGRRRDGGMRGGRVGVDERAQRRIREP